MENLISRSAGLNGGYVVFQASQGVVAQELFGNHAIDLLFAVPPLFESSLTGSRFRCLYRLSALDDTGRSPGRSVKSLCQIPLLR